MHIKNIFLASVLAIVLCLARIVHAMPAQILWIPQAQKPPTSCRLEAQNNLAIEKKKQQAPPYAMTVGAACSLVNSPDFRLEVGADWYDSHLVQAENVQDNLQLQLQMVGLDLERWGWALVGGQYGFAPNSDKSNYAVNYLMVQNQFDEWQIGLGGYIGNQELLVNHKGKAQNSGALFGLWYNYGRSQVAFEWQTGNNPLGFMLIGLKLNIYPNFTLTSGYGFANERAAHSDWLIVKMSYFFL